MMRAWLVGAVCTAVFSSAIARGDDSDLKFRGVGTTRQSLDALQLKPFDTALWSKLKDWTPEFKPETAAGKPVLVVTWASWRATSHPAMRLAQAAHTKYADKGLIVLGVHNPRGFDAAGANAKDLGVTFPIASDPDGKFRTALKADADPNVYMIDRAGNLRFAQLDPASIEAAAAKLTAETAEQAGAIPTDLAKMHDAAERAKYKTDDLTVGRLDPAPKIEYVEPDEDTYKRVKWPYLVGKIEQDDITEKIQNTPPTLTIPEENWYPAKPDTAGKIRALYVVDPLDTDMLNVLPVMNKLAIKHQRDLVVMASTFKLGAGDTSLSSNDGDKSKMVERNEPAVRAIIAANRINHAMCAEQAKISDLENVHIPFQGRRKFAACLILSTDGKVRWVGNPYQVELFDRAVESLAAIDPGVAARRKAEDAARKK